MFCSSDTTIVNVSPSDFDGDGCLDILISTQSQTDSKTITVYVYWGNSQTLGTLAQFLTPGNTSLP